MQATPPFRGANARGLFVVNQGLPSLRDVLRSLERRAARRAPVVSTAAEPRDGGWHGGPALPVLPVSEARIRDARAALAAAPPSATADPPPPWWALDPAGVSPKARNAARLASTAVIAATTGSEDSRAASELLVSWRAWLDADRPGRGEPWIHTTDLVARILHQALALSWMGPRVPLPLRRRVAGSVDLHLSHLERRLSPPKAGDPRRALQLCGLAAGALCWPALPHSGRRLASALAALPGALDRLVHPDGTPRSRSPRSLAEGVLHLELLRLLLASAHRTLPRGVEPTLTRALAFVAANTDSRGRLPTMGAHQPVHVLPLDDPPATAAALAHLAASRDLVPLPAFEPPLLARVLVGDRLAGAAAPPDPPRRPRWRLQAWRSGSWAVGRAEHALGQTRVFFDAGRAAFPPPGPASPPLSLAWHLGGRTVLRPSAPTLEPLEPPDRPARRAPRACHLEQARHRADDLDLVGTLDLGRVRPGSRHRIRLRRRVRTRGFTIRIEDVLLEPSPPQDLRLSWNLGRGWHVQSFEADHLIVEHEQQAILHAHLDPGLSWHLVSPSELRPDPRPLRLVGTGEVAPGNPVICTFTLE